MPKWRAGGMLGNKFFFRKEASALHSMRSEQTTFYKRPAIIFFVTFRSDTAHDRVQTFHLS